MQSDTQPDTPREPGHDRHDGEYHAGRPASDYGQPGSPDESAGLARNPVSRKFVWSAAALLLAAAIGAAVWGASAWQTNRTIANVESVLAARPLPAAQGAAPAAALPDVAPDVAAVPAPVSADRLPPLVLPGQPVPAAVLRDLPEWVAAEMGTVETSGGSGDESAAPASAPALHQAPAQAARERSAAAPRQEGYGAVFKRCPGPGESGAVQCRRAVCDGAAKKLAACAPYLK